MSIQKDVFPLGFGERLKDERRRLGLSQEEFAERAGVKRLAQLQYEKEIREPRTSYLAALGAMGISLSYVLFGRKSLDMTLAPEATRRIEKKIFDLIDEYAATQCNGVLSSHERFVLFEVMRAHCIQAELNGRNAEEEAVTFLPKRA